MLHSFEKIMACMVLERHMSLLVILPYSLPTTPFFQKHVRDSVAR